ncbi:MAG: hypothetical protein A2Z03_02250 [Chloroflexi bacterium RBG_16_56_8]|nr:MAG: hypothetical protein A2Z03_02250 [Chloroflexi bacterium RBG_16_56_8]
MYLSRVFGWIEHPNVSLVHPQVGEPAFGGAFSQDSAGVWLPLDCANWIVSDNEVGKQSASASSKKVH